MRYVEPVGKTELEFKLVPLSELKPAPFQREISEAHVKKLSEAMLKVGMFIDPLVVYEKEGIYYVVNGQHRLEAYRNLFSEGELPCIVIPEEKAKFIITLNTEKSPSIKDKSTEALKIYREMLSASLTEKDILDFIAEPCYVTFGILYERNEKFPASALHSLIKRIDKPIEKPLSEAFEERKRRADRIEELYENYYIPLRNKLLEEGVNQLYVGQIIASRINPFGRKRIIEEDFDSAMDKIIEKAKELIEEESNGNLGLAG
jgi:ParB family chromosome partitioning protein